MPTTDKLLKHLGLVGNTGFHTGSLVPRARTPQADQDAWRELQDSGRIADPDIWTKFNTLMRRPTTFDSMLQLWEEMSCWDLLAAALVEITDEATQTDSTYPESIWFESNDSDVEEDLNNMLQTIDAETIIQSQVWYIAGLGNHFEKLEYAPNEGVLGMSFVHPMEVRRYWLEKNRKCIGYRWMGHQPNRNDVFVMPDNASPVERVSLNSGKTVEDLWYPWDMLHFRRMFRLRISEHGEPVFAEAEGIYKKLRLAIDQMVVARAQVQPDRYAINIDVGEQTPIEQMRTRQRWMQALRSKLAFGQQGAQNQLNTPSDFLSYYNAWALDTVLYLAQPKGFQHAISKIPGTAQIPDVYDIELLTELFFAIIGMPAAWLSSKRDQQSMPSGKALLAQDIRFLRKIKSIRRPIVNAYTWLGYFHAVLKGRRNLNQLEIKAQMPPVGTLEDQLKMETLKMQAEVLDLLGDVMDKYKLPKEAWVEVVFKKYMHLPDEVVNVFITALPEPIEPAVGESRKPAPGTRRILEEVEKRIGQTPEGSRLMSQMRQVLREEKLRPPRLPRYRSVQEVLNAPNMAAGDMVVSSFGKNPLLPPVNAKLREGKSNTVYGGLIKEEARAKSDNGNGQTSTEQEQPKAPAYRRYMGEKISPT